MRAPPPPPPFLSSHRKTRTAAAQLLAHLANSCGLLRHSTVGFEKFGNISSIGADNAAVFASDPGIIPSTLNPPKELEEDNKKTVLIAQLTVKEGTEFVWQFNVQGMLSDKVPRHTWQEHGICATNAKDSKHCKKFQVEHTTKAYSVRWTAYHLPALVL